MHEWKKQIQLLVDEIDKCIRKHDNEALTLRHLSQRLGYSEFYVTRKFRETAGMKLKDYLRRRKLAFALKEVRDSEKSILEIALDHGYSSSEAFSRTFKAMDGIAPGEFRKNRCRWCFGPSYPPLTATF